MCRWFVFGGVAILMGGLTLVMPTVAAGQSAEEGNWQLSRTPWGDPDLQGIWSSKTTTPLERADVLDGREFLTEDEIASLEGRALKAFTEGSGASLLDERSERGTAIDVAGAYNSVFSSRGTTVVRTGRTSLVIDPTDGKIPYSEEGLEQVAKEVTYRKALFASDLRTVVDMAEGPEDRPNDRCLGFTLPCTANYCAFSRIVQNPGSVSDSPYYYSSAIDLNQNPFSIYIEDRYIWVGTADGLNRGEIIDENCINWLHYKENQPGNILIYFYSI